MATVDRQISALEEATNIYVNDLFVLQQDNKAKKLTGQTLIANLAEELDGHGGITSIVLASTVGREKTYTITYADGSTSNFVVTDGEKGDTGDQTYLHIRYSDTYPVTSMLLTPNEYIGVYTGTESEAPSEVSDYTWFKWKGEKGDTGVSIQSIAKASTVGSVDTYLITFDDGNTETFTVTNGSNISSIAKTATAGLVDTYTVTLTNGNTSTFTVTNAKSISSITMVSGNHAAGTTDTYRITFNDGDTTDFTVYNGANGTGAVSSVAGIGVSGSEGDVPLILWGNGAPTSSTAGQSKQLYFNQSSGIMYICTGESGGTYSWASMGITVDNVLSSSSSNPVANAVLTALLGTTSLNTVAQTITGAINELLVDKASATDVSTLQTDVSSLQDDVADLKETFSTAVPINKGGTGATSAAGARTNLDLDVVSASVTTTYGVVYGRKIPGLKLCCVSVVGNSINIPVGDSNVPQTFPYPPASETNIALGKGIYVTLSSTGAMSWHNATGAQQRYCSGSSAFITGS